MNSNIFEKKKKKILNLYKEKEYQKVIISGLKLFNEKSNDAQIVYLLGLAFIHLQKFLDAEKYFEILLSLKKTADIYYTFGNLKKKLKKYNEAVIAFEMAIKLNPNFSEAYNNLGTTKKIVNEKDQAILYFKKAVSLKKNNIQALINLSSIYKENNNINDLIIIYKKILDIDKGNIKTLYNLGSAYLFLGNISKGREYFEKVLELDKSHIPSIRNYVNITKIVNDDKFFDHLANIDFGNFSHEDKILAFDALSKGYFDKNKIETGFSYLNKSNSLKKEKSKFSLTSENKKFEKIKTFFINIENLELHFNNNFNIKPIFIIGMPRSGTSLLEQILATHSQIHGAGELYYLQKIIDQLGINKPANIKNYFTEIREYYYKNISKISNKPYIIDKLPGNFRWIGFIVNAFPEAKILHIQRNPMAVCWSNFKTFFVDSALDFNLDQEDMANYYSLYVTLMKFWADKFNSKILNINYENFVNDFETSTKKILGHLDLQWEKQIKEYDKTDRIVRTASFQQVRSKIKKNTSLEWVKFSDFLDPMKKILAKNNIKF